MTGAPYASLSADEVLLSSRVVAGGLRQVELSLPGIHCGGCVQRIERALGSLPGVDRARVNLSTKRVAVTWRSDDRPPPLGEALTGLGYEAHLQDWGPGTRDVQFDRLIRALAVAGFAAMNIMALSVSVWVGAADDTRNLFHWISAAIALPALLYSGRIFFVPALEALRHGRVSLDVPVSIGVLLTFGMSLADTIQQRPYAYFDAAVSLLFFLLIGRTLDHAMRARARTAVRGLERLAGHGALVVGDDGRRVYRPIGEIAPGMAILLRAGERVPVDALVIEGRSDIDCGLATGEGIPEAVSPGSRLCAGTLNLTGPLTIRATAAAKDSFLAEMVRLIEAAEAGRSPYRRLADRAARLYVPLVHGAAVLAFAGWMLATGDAHRAITIAVAVLVITCPCALGLAVPMVQVVAASRLFARGIMVRDGSALERLAGIDTIVFDKTGTLTMGRPVLRRVASDSPGLAVAFAMAGHSRHPYALALAEAGGGAGPEFEDIVELPGRGIEARAGADLWRLGRSDWAGSGKDAAGAVLSRNGQCLEAFDFEDEVRPGASEAVARLRQEGFRLLVVSGDRAPAARQLAGTLGIDEVHAPMLPSEKSGYLRELERDGRRLLMVGDGLNDGPALATAHVSMAPGNAADIGRQIADFVFLLPSLAAVPFAIETARASRTLIRQNFAFAAAYNCVAIPFAMAGLVTPLIAALAMSASSILVVANALRLSGDGR